MSYRPVSQNPPTATPWAVVLPAESAAAMGHLRSRTGIQVGTEGNEVWLRGTQLDDDLDLRLRQIPGGQLFEILEGGQLRLPGRRVPQNRLPTISWQPLGQWLQPALPSLLWPGHLSPKVACRLVRAESEQPARLLLTTLAAWKEYASSAPQVRLDRWRFALSRDGRAIIEGEPLPPLPGERFTVQEGVAVPSGWTWTPAVSPAVLRQLFQLGPEEIALWHPAGDSERIQADQFVRASRSAVRLSAEAATSPEEPEREESGLHEP